MKQSSLRARTALFLFVFHALAAGAVFGAEKENPPPSPKNRPTVALVLSGGSAYGLAHIGVIKVIEEMGIPVDIVVGTSMGSIVGGLYSIGYDAAALDRIARETDWTDLFFDNQATGTESYRETMDRSRYAAALGFDRKGLSINGGLIRGYKILRFIDSLTLSVPSPVDFDRLNRRYRAVATDVATGDQVVLGDGSVAEAMRSSMSIPGIFEPFCLKGQYLVDGGLVDNLPIDLARKLGADIVIAVDLVNGQAYDPETANRTPLEAVTRSLDIFMRNAVVAQLPHADLVIPVDIQGFLVTDFTMAAALIAQGETTARAEKAGLEAILKRVGAETAPEAPTLPPVASIIVEGLTGKDKTSVEEIFGPLVGTVPDDRDLAPLYLELDRKNIYGRIRVRRDSLREGFPLIVEVSRKDNTHNLFQLNFLYETTFSGAITGNLNLIPSVSLPGLTTDDSVLVIDAELVDAPSVEARFHQPVGRFFSVIPFYAYRRDFTTRLTSTSSGYQYQTIWQTAGADLALYPAPGVMLQAGWSGDWITSASIPDIPETDEVDSASLLHVRAAIRHLDAQIFPSKGIVLSADWLCSRTELGSEREFRTLETSGELYLRPGEKVTLGILWKGGTDFSVDDADPLSAPAFYKPDLSGRRLFPGPLRTDERIGSHVAALGACLRIDPKWAARGLKLPVFILLDAAAGAVVQDPRNTDWSRDVFHWNATAGVGLRVGDAFGVAVRGGVQRSSDRSYAPFVALDLGSIGY